MFYLNTCSTRCCAMVLTGQPVQYCAHDLGRLVDTMTRPFRHSEVKCLMMQVCA